ncbi:GDSL esterase/lipase 6 [Morella rubra]|uniref:GDSL esterase/lipase 6 n=1 Tax=Morella rubra TaxID=262757 RepID=A0A6A1UGP2_9ROSI|nr:GDSL esterase/lipase 6 [Morella rubra]
MAKLVLTFLLLSTLQVLALSTYVPAIFTFGDSIFDGGNNHFNHNISAQADFPPYGSSYFPSPTGRFTNGRTVVDFISQYVGIEFQQPYLEAHLNVAKGSVKSYPSNGINFASAGSGFFDVNDACCGAGALRGQMQCGRGPYTVCDNPDEFVFWDLFHPTEHTYRIVANGLWSGHSAQIRPVNLKFLATLHKRA